MMEVTTSLCAPNLKILLTMNAGRPAGFPLKMRCVQIRGRQRNSGQAGTGQTLNMSSGGMLLKVGSPLPVGQQIEVSVDWPAQLSEHCGLKLVALGKVVRSSPEETAVSIDKYDFRTRATKALEVAATASAL